MTIRVTKTEIIKELSEIQKSFIREIEKRMCKVIVVEINKKRWEKNEQ